MEIRPQLFTARVMHKRLFPKVNGFTYGVYYLALPLSHMASPALSDTLKVNRFGFVSYHETDHAHINGSNDAWIKAILQEHGLSTVVDEVMLVTMPRILGYVFNPVSFWLCFDTQRDLRAVLCEVNNTFGETHSYLCANQDHSPINNKQWLEAQKLFHVSPFLKREGFYRFRFSIAEQKLGIWIDFYNSEGKKQLLTALTGTLSPLTKRNLFKTVLKHPLVTFKTIMLIHWQALKLVAKGIKYIPKPNQKDVRFSKTDDK